MPKYATGPGGVSNNYGVPTTQYPSRFGKTDIKTVYSEFGFASGAKPETASRVLTNSDLETILLTTSASPVVFTIQTDALMLNSNVSSIAAYQAGTGAVSFAAGAGVSPIRGTAPTAAQYTTVGIMRVGANEWAYL